MANLEGLKPIAIGTLVMAAVSTFADAFWAAALPEHRTIYGLVHGGLVLAVLGLMLGRLSGARKPLLAAVGGLMIGILAAALFYVLFPVIGIPAMVTAWMILWVAFAFLSNALAAKQEPPTRTVVRGVAAAIFSGIGFWLISGIWLGPHDPGPLYFRNFVAWCIAFLPGFASLLLGRPSRS